MKKQSAPSPLSLSALAEQGREQLRLCRFKEAAESFKQLLRREPGPEWKSLLDEAYVGRARALAGKGMFKEAQIVLDNTLDSKGVARDPGLYLACLIRQGQHRKAAECTRKLFNSGVAGTVGGFDIPEIAVVLGLAAPEAGGSAASAPAELALAAWCAGASADEIDRSMSAIPLRSPAKPLRLVLKSLQLTDGEADKRAGLLDMIPASSSFSALGRAAGVALKSAEEVMEAWGSLTPAQKTFVAELRGIPVASARLLKDIEEAESRGPEAVLTLLLAQADRLPKPELRAACLELLPRLLNRLHQIEARLGPITEFEKNRALAFAAEADQDFAMFQMHWNKAAELIQIEARDDWRLSAAIIYRHIAATMRKIRNRPLNESVDTEIIDYLERALEFDPEHVDSLLELLDLHLNAGQIKEWTRWVEWAVPRFPDHTAVLEAAVEAAAKRNAYKKAATFAHKLLAIDPINQRARQRMIELRIAHARKQMRANRADLALKELTEAAEWERSGCPDPLLGICRAMVLGRLATKAGDEGQLEAAVKSAGAGVSGWFRVMLETKFMGYPVREAQPMLRKLSEATKVRPLVKEDVLATVSLLGHQEVRTHKLTRELALSWIEPWLSEAGRCEWSLEEFQTIAEILQEVGGFKALAVLARHALKSAPEQPAYRFYEIVARIGGDTRQLREQEEDVLISLSDMAASQKDFHLVNRIGRLLKEAFPSSNFGYFEDECENFADDDISDFGISDFFGYIGLDAGEIIKIARLSGIDDAVRYVMNQVSILEKKRKIKFPIPKIIFESISTNFIKNLLDDEESIAKPSGRRRK